MLILVVKICLLMDSLQRDEVIIMNYFSYTVECVLECNAGGIQFSCNILL